MRAVVNVETVEWGGVTWRRYPDAKRRNHRVYFQGYLNGVLTSLHRAKWEAVNGPIPDGHEIHHADRNPLNNDLGNLECLTRGDHLRKEAELGSFSSPKVIRNLNRIRPLASAWHGSEEGLRWHSEHARRMAQCRQTHDLTCRHCATAFTSKNGYAMYCSPKCGNLGRGRTVGKYEKTCEQCSVTFKGDRTTSRFCSKSCRAKWQWKNQPSINGRLTAPVPHTAG